MCGLFLQAAGAALRTGPGRDESLCHLSQRIREQLVLHEDRGKGQRLSGRRSCCVGRQAALEKSPGLPGLLRKDELKGGPSHCSSSPRALVAGVGKSSLLLRFADNTFSGESSLGAVGVLWFWSPLPYSRAHLLLIRETHSGCWMRNVGSEGSGKKPPCSAWFISSQKASAGPHIPTQDVFVPIFRSLKSY